MELVDSIGGEVWEDALPSDAQDSTPIESSSSVPPANTDAPRETSTLPVASIETLGEPPAESGPTPIFAKIDPEKLALFHSDHLDAIAFNATHAVDTFLQDGSRDLYDDVLPNFSRYLPTLRDTFIRETAERMINKAIEFKCGKVSEETTREIFPNIEMSDLARLNITMDTLRVYAHTAIEEVNKVLGDDFESSWEAREIYFRHAGKQLLETAVKRAHARGTEGFNAHEITLEGLLRFKLSESGATPADGEFSPRLTTKMKDEINQVTTNFLNALARSGFIEGDPRHEIDSLIIAQFKKQSEATKMNMDLEGGSGTSFPDVLPEHASDNDLTSDINPHEITLAGLTRWKPKDIFIQEPDRPYRTTLTAHDRADLALAVRIFTEAFRRSGYITGVFNEELYNELTRILLAKRMQVPLEALQRPE